MTLKNPLLGNFGLRNAFILSYLQVKSWPLFMLIYNPSDICKHLSVKIKKTSYFPLFPLFGLNFFTRIFIFLRSLTWNKFPYILRNGEKKCLGPVSSLISRNSPICIFNKGYIFTEFC